MTANPHVYFDRLRESIQRHGSKSCFHIKRNNAYQSWTYNDFAHDCNACGHSLIGRGVREKDACIIIGENTPEWVIAYHGAILARARAVPLDPQLCADDIREIVEKTRAPVVFCSPVYLPLFQPLQNSLPFFSTLVVLDENDRDAVPCFNSFLSKSTGDDDLFSHHFNPDDQVAILFTSGTTGKSKGVILNQANLSTVSRRGVPRMNVSSRDTMAGILPLHHVFGFAACVAAALPTGIDVVFVPVLKGPAILEALQEKHVSILPAVPQMLERFYVSIEQGLRKKNSAVRVLFLLLCFVSKSIGSLLGMQFRARLFSSIHRNFGGRLRCIISGGSSLKKKFFDGFRIFGFGIVEGYGLTETFGPITLCPITTPRHGSVGPVFEDNEMRIHNPNEKGIGEVCFRGETVFPGYFLSDSSSADCFDKSGWFHTGDLGYLDEEGYLFLVGRSKDCIVLDSGKNVYPDDIEEFYASSSIIEEIAVFGIENRGCEIVAALIVPAGDVRKSHTPAQATEIIGKELSRMGRTLPAYKRPAQFLVDFQQLPRTTTRKIIKEKILERFRHLSMSGNDTIKTGRRLSYLDSKLMESEEFRVLSECLAAILTDAHPEAWTPATHLEFDLGLDSLKSLDLMVMVEERFSIPFPEEGLQNVETLGDTATLISAIRQKHRATDS